MRKHLLPIAGFAAVLATGWVTTRSGASVLVELAVVGTVASILGIVAVVRISTAPDAYAEADPIETGA